MTKEEAFQLVVGACAAVNTDLASHQRIQDALGVLNKELGFDVPDVPAAGGNGTREKTKA